MSPDETRAIGRELRGHLALGDVVLLKGDLGSGKTTFTQGVAAALGIEGDVQSPTFTIVAEYPIAIDGEGGTLVHVDLYRLSSRPDLSSIGIDEYLDREDAIVVIEWPERLAPNQLPPHWSVEFTFGPNETRIVTISPPANE